MGQEDADVDCADPQHDTGTAAFYDTNAGPLYSYCLSLCADSDIAANAFHRAMLRAWESGGERARAFALARAECRMRGLRVPMPRADDECDAPELTRVFTRLPPRDAEAAELTLRYGLGATELAAVFGLPVAHAERLVADARDLFADALTAESQVGVSEGAVLGELVRAPHPLARVAALLPCREPDAGLRERVMAGLHRRTGTGRGAARRPVPGVVWARSSVRAGGTRRSRTGRMIARSAAIACSVVLVVGFVTALSRPSAVGTVPKPSTGTYVAPPRSPSPPVRVGPSRRQVARSPAASSAATGGHRRRPVVARTPGAAATQHARRHISGRGHHADPDPGDELARLYERWRERQRERYGHDQTGHRRVYQRGRARHHHRYDPGERYHSPDRYDGEHR